jgi:hypothetical protein
MRRSDWYLASWNTLIVTANRVFGQASMPTQQVVFRSEA